MRQQARLVWITEDAEKHIAYCARVSNPKNQENEEFSRLLKYCKRKGHWSVFEMASACFELKTTIAVAQQIIRHKSFSFQVFSQRYSEVQDMPAPIKLRLKHPTNRQSSIDVSETGILHELEIMADEAVATALVAYDAMIKGGVAPETARNVLPMCTPTTLYMSGTLRSWIHYLESRLDEGTQSEHQELAKLIHAVLKNRCPTIWGE
jgi:thymidylate synthase (FAD)